MADPRDYIRALQAIRGRVLDAFDRESIDAEIAALTPPKPVTPADLHPATADLVTRFAMALADKLLASQKKYGWDTHWQSPSWMDQCRQQLVEHVAKGDPRDVAAYCAFLWHHGESTAIAKPVTPAGGEVEPVAWRYMYADSDGWTYQSERPNDPPNGNPCGKFFEPLYTHPPVAEAALPRGHSISDARQALGVDGSLNIDALRGLLRIYEKCSATGQREVIALKAAIAALNQRGGGDHG